ncbi:MAG: response regulator, partial [Anaerolineales bacterium]|nr:response regulator [Anaerolineales bacterium]
MKSILLVEDNPNDRLLMERALRKTNLGNPLAVAQDGQEALDYLLGTADTPPRPLPILVLLDLKLPKIDGLEVLEAIRSHERTELLPVVI